MKHCNKYRESFTLIEAVVSAVLIAVVMSAVTMILYGAVSLYRHQHNTGDMTGLERAFTRISADISSCRNFSRYKLYFKGYSHGISSFALGYDIDIENRIYDKYPYIFEYVLRNGILYRRVEQGRAALVKNSRFKEEALLEQIQKIDFYYGRCDKRTKTVHWLRSWTASEQKQELPDVVGVKIVYGPEADMQMYKRIIPAVSEIMDGAGYE